MTNSSTGLNDNLRGAGLMAGSMAAFAINDAMMKTVVVDMPMAQAVVLRGILAMLFLGLLAVAFGQFRFSFPRRDWWLILLRSIAEIGMTWYFLRALAAMPLANLHAVMQALPLTVALAAALILREPLGWRRFAAIAVGFVGVMLIIRPGPDGFGAGTLNGLAAVGFITLRDLIARKLSPAVPSLAAAFVTATAITLFFTFQGMTEPWQMPGWSTSLLIAGTGFAIFFGYLLSLTAMRVGDIGFSAPFRYTGLIVALGLGWVFYGEWPEALTFVGAGIVVATGLFTVYRERQIARQGRGQVAAVPPQAE